MRSPESHPMRSKRGVKLLCVVLVACHPVLAQAPDEHAQHHPAPADAGAPAPMQLATPASSVAGTSKGAGMMGMSGQPARQLYPALMALPDLPPEQRAEIEREAYARMSAGASQMTAAVTDMTDAIARQDFAVMQESTARMSAALREFESGLVAQRALAEGQAPRNIALRWFKREMSLADPIAVGQPHGVFGLSSFHYLSMFLLAAFALLTSWMYVARNRRVSALLASLRTGELQPGIAGVASLPSAPATPSAAQTPGATPSRAEPIRVPPSVTGNWAGKLRVARIFQETPTVKTFRLAPIEGSGSLPFMFEPGQFLTVSAAVDGQRVKRSYSIASSPCCHGWCDITVKHESGGIVSGYLHAHIKEGDQLDASGPYGRFTFRGHEAPSVVFIAGGVGITPLMSSIRYLTDQSWNGRIDLIYACSRLDAVIFREELDHLARRHPNLHVTIVLNSEPSAEWQGPRGYVTPDLLAGVPDIRSRRIHLCGPPVMMEAVTKALGNLGITGDAIKTEVFLSAPPAQSPSPAPAPEAAVTCSFARSNQSAPLVAGQTVLECAESIGVPIEYACRQGYCGICKVKLLAGDVTMTVQDGLTPVDKSAGLILACQAKSVADVMVDA